MSIMKLDAKDITRDSWVADRDSLLDTAGQINEVVDDETFVVSGRVQTALGKHFKKLEKIRMDIKRPITAWVKENIDSKAKEMCVELNLELKRIKKLNGEFATKRAAAAEKERERIAMEEADRAMSEPVTFGGVVIETAQEVMPDIKVKTGANSVVEVYDFDVIDARKVASQFLSVDPAKVKAFIKYIQSVGQKPEAEGIRFTSRMDVRAR